MKFKSFSAENLCSKTEWVESLGNCRDNKNLLHVHISDMIKFFQFTLDKRVLFIARHDTRQSHSIRPTASQVGEMS